MALARVDIWQVVAKLALRGCGREVRATKLLSC